MFLLPEYLAITMEYAAGGDLFQLVGRAGGLREEDAKWYFQQLIVAIDYCHRMVSAGLHRARSHLAGPQVIITETDSVGAKGCQTLRGTACPT